MPTTSWLAATSGQTPLAQHVNQFLVPHPTTYLYTGNSQASVVTSGATTTGTNNLWLAQSFTTGASQTAIGYVQVPVSTTTTSGANLAPTTLSLYANSAGAPTGSALVSTTVTAEFANRTTSASNNVFTTIPLPITGLTAATTYWLVLHSTASTGQFTWFRSASASGASTSTNGTTWTAQSYGFRYNVFDQFPGVPLVAVWGDSGARWWVGGSVQSSNQPGFAAEYTAGQTATSYNQGFRTYFYAGALLTGTA